MNCLYRHKLFVLVALVLALTQAQAHPASAAIRSDGLVTGELTYHGGNVMHNPTNYLIFWLPGGQSFEPSGSAYTDGQFEGLLQQYFQDVCGTEYYNILTPLSFDPANPTNPVVKNGVITNACTYGGSWVDTTTYPHAGTSADALTDGDIRNAISRARTANPGWGNGANFEYFVYTGYGIQECGSSQCTYPKVNNGPFFCGYHTYWSSSDIVYAYISVGNSQGASGGCFAGTSPNNGAADAAANTSSHEQFEAVSDPGLDAWYNGDGSHENGDQCNFYFGNADTNADGTNFIFNAHKYRLQWEWLNRLGSADTSGDYGNSGCAPSYTHTDGGIEHPDDATFSVTGSAGPASIPGNPSDVVTLTVNFTNNSGTDGAYNTTTSVDMGPFMTFAGTVSGPASTQSVNTVGDTEINYNTGTLGVGASGTIILKVSPKKALPDGQNVFIPVDLSGSDQEGCFDCLLTTNGWSGGITFTVANTPPQWLPVTDKAVDYNDPLSFGVGVRNPEFGDTVTLKASGLPAGLTFTDHGDLTGTVSGTPTAVPGTYPVTFAANDGHHPDVTTTANIVVNPEESVLTYTGATAQDYNDQTTLSATLTEDGDSTKPLAGRSITFNLGPQSCTGTTNATGSASCSITPNESAGSYPLSASFGGDTYYTSSASTGSFTVNLEEASAAYTGDTVIAVGGNTAHLSGTLKEDGVTPIAGRTLTLTIGTAPNSNSCTGTTDATGAASCTISPVNVPLGPELVSANFATDGYYLSASGSQTATVFGFLKTGSFVVGDQSVAGATPSTSLTWWSDVWYQVNSLSGGPAPSPFKGFLQTTSTTPAVCGGSWTTTTGNSPAPPATVPSYMGVAVTKAVTKSGNTMTGKITKIIVIKTNPGYAPSPQSPGTGTMVATYC